MRTMLHKMFEVLIEESSAPVGMFKCPMFLPAAMLCFCYWDEIGMFSLSRKHCLVCLEWYLGYWGMLWNETKEKKLVADTLETGTVPHTGRHTVLIRYMHKKKHACHRQASMPGRDTASFYATWKVVLCYRRHTLVNGFGSHEQNGLVSRMSQMPSGPSMHGTHVNNE